MGTWGTALFSDDTAADVREDFKTYIGDGLTSEDATAALIRTWDATMDDVDAGPTFWLVLASTQWTLGRLVPDVLTAALQILERGGDLHRWAHDKNLCSKRRLVLEKLRAQLTSPPPPPKRVPPKFRNANEWTVGSVHVYRLNNAELCLLRVIGHHTDNGGTAPIVELLDWVGVQCPERETINQLKVRRYHYPNGREISQFMLAATSERERNAARISDTGIVSRPAQDPSGYSVFLWRGFDHDLARLFGLGVGSN